MALSLKDFNKALEYYNKNKKAILYLANSNRGNNTVTVFEQLQNKFPEISISDVRAICWDNL